MASTPLIIVARATHDGDYLEAVRRTGGNPRLVDHSMPPDEVWRSAHGVLLTGGPDVDPRLYGEVPDRHHQPSPEGRDAFELELATRAIERDLPLLAICRGIQVLNVAAGGTLVQHIPDQVPGSVDHQVKTKAWTIAHEVQVGSGTLLSRALGLRPGPSPLAVAVNSRHHQAVKHVGAGLVAVAAAPDGVIEAIERPASRFCLGVQWHPENFWQKGEFDTLFAAFVDACRTRP